MKRNRMTAMLLSALMGLPFLNGIVSSAEIAEDSTLHMAHYENYQQYLAAKMRGASLSPMVTANAGETQFRAALPSAYDLRSDGLITSVKDQHPYGTCWSFATMASLESTMIARNAEVDLSEWHLAYYAYSENFGFSLEDTDGETAERFDAGGNYVMLAPLLCGWLGPVDEQAFPYDDWDVLENDKTLDELRQEAQYHVTDVSMLAYDVFSEDTLPAQIENVKQVVYDGHAVALNYFDSTDYYNSDTYAYYYDGDYSSGGYHAVTIAGWDDNFSADNFTSDPGMDGAWLIRNSWGADWGDNGYFWISYADTSIFDLYYLEAEAKEVHSSIYQHDDYGYWSAVSVSDAGDEYGYMANVFTAEEDTWITSVTFCSAVENENYEITLYTDLRRKNNPTSGTAAASAEGLAVHAGYHTVELSEPVFVPAGEAFSLAVKIGGETGLHITCESSYETVETYPDGTVETSSSYLTEDMLRAEYSSGQSFYSADGESWYDTYDATITSTYTYSDGNGGEVKVESTSVVGNVCVKALGQSADFVLFSDYSSVLPAGTEITLSAPGGEEIYYAVDGGEEQLYNEPILFTEDMAISARTASGETMYQRDYTVQRAKLSSLLCIDTMAYLSFSADSAGNYSTVYPADGTAPSSLTVQPISTGTITCNGEALASGEVAVVTPSAADPSVIVLSVSEDGMTTTTYTIRLTEGGDLAIGDVNCDGIVNSVDAADVLIYTSEAGSGAVPVLPDEQWPQRADFDGDGTINSVDASAILVYAAEIGSGGGA